MIIHLLILSSAVQMYEFSYTGVFTFIVPGKWYNLSLGEWVGGGANGQGPSLIGTSYCSVSAKPRKIKKENTSFFLLSFGHFVSLSRKMYLVLMQKSSLIFT